MCHSTKARIKLEVAASRADVVGRLKIRSIVFFFTLQTRTKKLNRKRTRKGSRAGAGQTAFRKQTDRQGRGKNKQRE
jgi:hypothetical protein